MTATTLQAVIRTPVNALGAAPDGTRDRGGLVPAGIRHEISRHEVSRHKVSRRER